MKRNTRMILATTAILAIVLLAIAWVGAVETRLPWYVISGGNGHVQSGKLHLQHSVGQPVSGPAHGVSLQAGGGFWPGVARAVPPPRRRELFLPMIGTAGNGTLSAAGHFHAGD